MCAGLVLALGAQAQDYLGAFPWNPEKHYYGDFSGIEVSPDGSRFYGIGDNGQTYLGTFERTEGRITGLSARYVGSLRNTLGERFGEEFNDAEGLAIAPDGTWYVSFERETRVLSYANRDAVSVPLPIAPEFRRMIYNRSLEALAIDANGALYTIPEKVPAADYGHVIYRYDDSTWTRAGELPPDAIWRVVGADFDDLGRLYVLDRTFAPPFRFASRLRRFTLTEGGLGPEDVLLKTPPGKHDNLEGVAIWRDDQGLRATMVSDDNGNFLQTTEFVEYRLPD